MFKEERQTLPIHMLAGMVAGGATRLMVAPLDVLKIRFQVQVDKKVQKSERILAPHYYYRDIIDGIRQIVKSEGLIVRKVRWLRCRKETSDTNEKSHCIFS
jgi:hypothetical protein